jgi:hypothetical protein
MAASGNGSCYVSKSEILSGEKHEMNFLSVTSHACAEEISRALLLI